MSQDLLAHHAELLANSAISPDVIQARGYFSAQRKAQLLELGFSRSQHLVPGLVIPLWTPSGEVGSYHLRPDKPRVVKGKLCKYEAPGGSSVILDVPPAARAGIRDPGVPLYITEGARKADSAVSQGLCCVSLMGTWCWCRKDARGTKQLLPDFDSLTLTGRTVYLAFDSDVTVKPSVALALQGLMQKLVERDAVLQVLYLPGGPDGAKVGLDDFFAAGHGVEELLACAETDLRPVTASSVETEYSEHDDGLYWNHPPRGGPARLTNFTAQITGDVVRDDGAERSRLYEIETVLRGRRTKFNVPAGDFDSLGWVNEHVGAGAIVAPGVLNREHARVAIKALSGDVPLHTSYAHLGWVCLAENWVYQHAGGALGADGALPDVSVPLDGALARYVLPEPPTGESLTASIRASLGLLEAAPPQVSFPVLAAIYRAVLGPCPHALHLTGYTGAGKSTFAALAQQHYGPKMDADNLPASWTSTANYLEGLLFAAKDALTVIDDLTLGESRRDREQAQRLAERVYRAQGNQQGRGRMRADATLKPTKYPRGLSLGTSEDLPAGQSLRARVMIIEFAPDTLDWAVVSHLQSQAAGGLFANAMAGYIQWLAPAYGDLADKHQEQFQTYRERARDSRHHRRTPELIASLFLGLYTLLEFATDIDAVDPGEADDLAAEGWEALGHAAETQLPYQASADLPNRFLTLMRSAVTAGSAYVADSITGREPKDAERWGWEHGNGLDVSWRPLGKRIGYTDGASVFLDPQLALGAAQRVAEDLGEHLGITTTTLGKQLHERGLLVTTDRNSARGTYSIRKTLAGSRIPVWHLAANTVNPTGAGPEPTSPPTDPTTKDPDASGSDTVPGQSGQFSFTLTPTPSAQSTHAAPAQPPDAADPPAARPDPPDPCPYPQHRTSDWVSVAGMRVCGICHPPADPTLVADRAPTGAPSEVQT